MNKDEAIKVLQLLAGRNWLGQPNLKALNGMRLPHPQDLADYVTFGPSISAANGINVGQIEQVLAYFCQFCKFMDLQVCPHIPKPADKE